MGATRPCSRCCWLLPAGWAWLLSSPQSSTALTTSCCVPRPPPPEPRTEGCRAIQETRHLCCELWVHRGQHGPQTPELARFTLPRFLCSLGGWCKPGPSALEGVLAAPSCCMQGAEVGPPTHPVPSPHSQGRRLSSSASPQRSLNYLPYFLFQAVSVSLGTVI